MEYGDRAVCAANDRGVHRVRIVIADDDLEFTRLLEHHLQACGHAVQVVADAIQAWRCAYDTPPHLVVLDIKMPAGTGLAVLRRLKSSEKTRHVPVVVVTAAEESGLLQSLMNLHPDAILRKPVQAADLDLEIVRLTATRGLAGGIGKIADP
jgi:CheY-like chemotaxis protein